MSRHRLLLGAANALAIALFVGSAATAADMHENWRETGHGPGPGRARYAESRSIMELQPGMVKILNLKPELSVQSIVVGNPNVVDVTAINLNAIALTGKGVGLTNVVLFDSEGRRISDTAIQVVAANVYRAGGIIEPGREVRVVRLWYGPSMQTQGAGAKQIPKDRRYICVPACSSVEVDEPLSLNPPGNTAAPVASKAEGLTPTPSGTPQGTFGGLAPGAPAPQGR